MKWAAAIVAAATLTTPAVAHATTPTVVPAPIATEVVQARTLALMREAWPASPCLDRLALQPNTTEQLREYAARDTLPPPPGVGLEGYATTDTCTAHVRADLDPVSFCITAVHEAGHLAGFEHVADRESIMYAQPDNYAPCEQAFPRTRWQQVYDSIRLWQPRAMIGLPHRHGRVYRIATRGTHGRKVWCLRFTRRLGRLYGPGGVIQALWGDDSMTLGERCG